MYVIHPRLNRCAAVRARVVCRPGIPAPGEPIVFCGRDANAKVDSEVETTVGRASSPIQGPSEGFYKGNVVARGTEDMVGRVQSDKS